MGFGTEAGLCRGLRRVRSFRLKESPALAWANRRSFDCALRAALRMTLLQGSVFTVGERGPCVGGVI